MSHLGPQLGIRESDVLVDRASLPPEATNEGRCKTTNSQDSRTTHFEDDHFQADGALAYGLLGRKVTSGSPEFHAPTYDKRTQKLPPLSSLPLAHHRPAPLRSASHNASVSTERNLPKLHLPPVPLSTAPVQPTFSVAPPIPFIPTSFGAQKSSCRPDAAQVASDYGDAKSHQYSHRYTSNVKPDPHTQLSAERSASRLPAVVSLLDGSPSTSVDGSSTHLSLRGGAASSGHKTTTTPTSENHKLVHLLDMRHGHNGSSTLEYPMRDSMIPPGWNTSGRVIAQRERLLKAAVEAATAVADSHFGMPQREHNPANNKTASSDIYHITDTTYGYRDGFRDGYKEGRKEGFRDERNYREAFKDGFREGRVGGYLDGKQEGYRGGGMVDGALATGLDEEWDIDQYGNLLESFKSKGWRGPSAHTTSRSVSNQIPQQIGRPPVEPAPLQIDTSASNRLDSQLPPHAQQHLSFSTSSSAVSPRSREAAPQTRNEISSNSNDRSPNGDSPDESTERHNRHHRRRSSNGQRHHSGSERDCEKRGSNDQRAANRRRDQRNSGSNSSESPDSSEGSRGYKRRSPERSSGASKNASNETNSNDGQNLSSSSRSADNSSPDAPSTDRKRKRQSDTNSSESPESGVEGDKRSRKNKKSSSSSSRSGSGSSSRSPTSEGNDSEKKRKRATKEQLDLLERVFEQEELPSRARRKELANELGFSPRRIQIWFQNRRAKSKKKEGKQYVMVNYGKHSFRKESRDSSGSGS